MQRFDESAASAWHTGQGGHSGYRSVLIKLRPDGVSGAPQSQEGRIAAKVLLEGLPLSSLVCRGVSV